MPIGTLGIVIKGIRIFHHYHIQSEVTKSTSPAIIKIKFRDSVSFVGINGFMKL